MKKTNLAFIASLFLSMGGATAQHFFPLREMVDSIRFHVAVVDGRLALEPLGRGTGFLSAIKLDDADLLATCTAERSGEKSPTSFAFRMRPDGGEEIVPAPGLFADPGEKSGATIRQLAWLDFTELGLEPGRSYTLFVQRNQMGWVDCNAPRPVFSLKKKMPFYAGAVTGAAMLVGGQLFYARKRDDYGNYVRLWKDERTGSEAQPFFDGAKKSERIAQTLTIGGLALLAIDAAFFSKKCGQTRTKQRTYDRFCTEKGLSLRISPFVESPGAVATATGLNLLFSF